MAEVSGVFNLNHAAILLYENVFKPQSFRGKGKERYDVTLGLASDHPDLQAMKDAAIAVARAKWPDRQFGAEVRAGTFKFPFENGDVSADKGKAKGKNRERLRGYVVLNARSEFEPVLSVPENDAIVEFLGDRRPQAKAHFYPGAEVLAEVNFQAYDGIDGNRDGVTCYLNKVFSTKRGERIAGTARSSADVFKGYAGIASDTDPTVGSVQDDVGF